MEPTQAAFSATCTVVGRTMGGNEHSFQDLPVTMKVAELKQQVATVFSAPIFTLQLLADSGSSSLDLVEDSQTLQEAGLANVGASMVIVRCPGSNVQWLGLFETLVKAMEGKNGSEARRLIDLGAGFDSDGNVLKLSNRWRAPWDRTCEVEEAGSTMLHLAVREGLKDLALYLIHRNVGINCENELRRTPLVQAVAKKQFVVVEALLQAQANTDVKDYMGRSALSYSVLQGNDELSAKLVAGSCEDEHTLFAGVAPCLGNACPNEEVPPVVRCCAAGMSLTAQALLNSGAPTDWRDSMGRSALHYAHEYKMPEVVVALVARGAEHSADNFGMWPEQGIQSPARENSDRPRCVLSFWR